MAQCLAIHCYSNQEVLCELNESIDIVVPQVSSGCLLSNDSSKDVLCGVLYLRGYVLILFLSLLCDPLSALQTL